MTKFYFIQMFAEANVQTTGVNVAGVVSGALSPTMKEYYDTELLKNARADLRFNQFAKHQPVPKKNGRKAEWRKFDAFPAVTTPLTEGVTPDGRNLSMTTKEAVINQYGDYVTVSDMLDLTAVDPVILSCTEELAAQAALTLDTLTRNTLGSAEGGDINISFAPIVAADGTETEVKSRASITANAKLTPSFINKLVTKLKKANTPRIDGKYVMIVHPSCAEDLRESAAWIEVHKYAATTEIFNGEIGELHGVRFVESTNVEVIKGGASNAAVYLNYIFGKDAYAVTDLEGAGLEMIVKPLGSAGSADPLNQRQTVAWKAAHGAAIIYPERIIRVECGSSYSATENANTSRT